MEKFLSNKSIFFRGQTFWLLVLFSAVRILSYFLNGHLVIQGLLVFIILMTLGVLYFKNPQWAWGLVLGEILLGGSGHYLEFLGLSIRTLLIGFFIFLWLAQLLGERNLGKKIVINKQVNLILIVLFVFLFGSIFNGLYHEHEFRRIIADIMPFTFLLLLFPSYYLFSDKKAQEFLVRLISVFIIGTATFSLTTLALFSNNITRLQDGFYKWYRDVDMGKITDMGSGFFRIVEPAHLLIVPIILIITSLLMRDERHHKMWRFVQILSIVILALNLSRAYFLALIVGLIILKLKHKWKQWLTESIVVVLLVIIIFSGIHLLASGGESLGWELFGVRIQSLTSPSIEISTNTRMMILPAAWQMITANPLLGVGLGATVTFLNPYTYEAFTTASFDWGYLEMWAELGILGALVLIGLYLFVAYKLLLKILNIQDWHDFDVGLLAGIVALLITNIAAPALFHVFGILYLIFAMTIAIKHTSIFDRTTTVLYQVFNRTK